MGRSRKQKRSGLEDTPKKKQPKNGVTHVSKAQQKADRRRQKTAPMIEFDPVARKEYLTGFRKRKQERRDKAQRQIADEKKKALKETKQENKERVESEYAAVVEARALAGLTEEAAVLLLEGGGKRSEKKAVGGAGEDRLHGGEDESDGGNVDVFAQDSESDDDVFSAAKITTCFGLPEQEDLDLEEAAGKCSSAAGKNAGSSAGASDVKNPKAQKKVNKKKNRGKLRGAALKARKTKKKANKRGRKGKK